MNKRITQQLVVLLTVLLGALNLSYAQQAATTIIDGSQHPELIPDSLAYRLYFIAVTSLPSLPANLQQAQLKFAGLSPVDVQAASKVLADFRTAYDSLSNTYNQQVEASDTTGVQPNASLYGLQRDTLVANTRTALQKALSPNSMQKFDAHVQGEKTRMKTSGVTTMN